MNSEQHNSESFPSTDNTFTIDLITQLQSINGGLAAIHSELLNVAESCGIAADLVDDEAFTDADFDRKEIEELQDRDLESGRYDAVPDCVPDAWPQLSSRELSFEYNDWRDES